MKKQLYKYSLSVVLLLLFSTMLLALFVCWGTLKTNTGTSIFADVPDELPAEAIARDVELAQTEDMGSDYIDQIIFLGESTTYGLWRYGLLRGGERTNQVWTGASCDGQKITCSGTLALSPSLPDAKIYFPDDGSAITISEALRRKKPRILVITLGLNNGASYYSEEQFKQCYQNLINQIISGSDSTKIILQSLFPVAKTCKIAAYTPERISLCNQWIYELATEFNLKYLNTFSVLADSNGYLYPQYDNGGDGIHLNQEGLEAVLQFIRTHGYRLEEEI